MNRETCEHFTPSGIPCVKCQTLVSTGIAKGCYRSHPHENMDATCERYTQYERELASLRQKQVLWEAGNRELADRLEARDVAIDALRAEKERAEREAANVSYAHACEVTLRERAEAERDEAIRMRDRHAEASKAQNEDITALMAERDAALKDAERYRWLRSKPSLFGWEHDFAPDRVDRAVDRASIFFALGFFGRQVWDYHTKEPVKECTPEPVKKSMKWTE